MTLPPIITHDQRAAIAAADELANIVGRLLILGEPVVADVIKLWVEYYAAKPSDNDIDQCEFVASEAILACLRAIQASYQEGK